MYENKRKTFGISGFVEVTKLIPCGKATLEVHFEGGALSGYGTTPAKYTTENPVYQHAIEHSAAYKRGEIVLLRESEGTGRYANGTVLHGSQRPGQASTASGEIAEMHAAEAAGTVADGAAGAVAEGAAEDVHDGGETEDGYTEVMVSDLEAARDYLVEKCNATRTSVRTMPGVLREAEARKIRFVGMD